MTELNEVYVTPKSDAGRAKTHYKLSDEDWNKLSDIEKTKLIKQLPPRTTRRENIITEPLQPDFQGILNRYKKQYGEEKGIDIFWAWVTKHELDPDKPYSNTSQLGECFDELCESFQWLKDPLISYYKSDSTGKYYRCVALTANISMNRNDYSDVTEFKQAAGTLTWRPLNLNHDHSKRLPFPDNRVDYAVFEDNRVETIIRIDNTQKNIQRMIEKGEILHPSIEATPRGMTVGDTKKPSMWNYTELALLQRNITLPGDPLTYLEPLPLNEGMGRSLVESLVDKDKEENTKLTTTKNGNENSLKHDLSEGQTVFDMDICGQCRYFTDLDDTVTTKPLVTGKQTDATVTTQRGAIGAGVGVCELATRLTGVRKLVRKNDPACTDARLRDSPTGVDRTKEAYNLNEIELNAVKADYERRIASLETQIIEETQRTNSERETKLKTMMDVSMQGNTLKEKERSIANLTSDNTRLKEERAKFREEIDSLREQVAGLNIGITERDKDIKHYKDRYDAYERTHKELNNETFMLKEQLTSSLSKRDEEATKRAEANQRALNAEQERARIAEENALLIEKLAKLQQEIYDSARVRADTAKTQIRDSKTIEELRGERDGLIETVRELKQKLNQRPQKYVVKA